MHGGTHREVLVTGLFTGVWRNPQEVWVTGLFIGVWRNPQGSVSEWAVYWCMEEPTGKCG